MKCASCSQSISIIQSLFGHKDCRSEHQERELEQSGIQRLMNALNSDEPNRLKALRSENVQQSGVMAVYPTTESQATSAITKELPNVEPEPGTLVMECSLAHGSWRCRCPQCLEADKVP